MDFHLKLKPGVSLERERERERGTARLVCCVCVFGLFLKSFLAATAAPAAS